MPNLAIVIPAYKQEFLQAALESIANQTNQEFTLYIGDDCSPHNLHDIVKKYESRIPIVYKFFKENVGGNDLVGQWERCIDLSRDEEWIWLFSDDDLMDKNCVDDFYNALFTHPDADLYHFNVEVIDDSGKVIDKFHRFPDISTVEEFLSGKLQMYDYSTAVEFIFRKSHFLDKGRFQRFDLAWGSDDATWIKLGKERGIRNVGPSKVYWRKSLLNISFNDREKDIIIRKLKAQIDFIKWIEEQSDQNEINLEPQFLQKPLKDSFIDALKWKSEYLSFEEVLNLCRDFQAASKEKLPPATFLYLRLFKSYRHLVRSAKTALGKN